MRVITYRRDFEDIEVAVKAAALRVSTNLSWPSPRVDSECEKLNPTAEFGAFVCFRGLTVSQELTVYCGPKLRIRKGWRKPYEFHYSNLKFVVTINVVAKIASKDDGTGSTDISPPRELQEVSAKMSFSERTCPRSGQCLDIKLASMEFSTPGAGGVGKLEAWLIQQITNCVQALEL